MKYRPHSTQGALLALMISAATHLLSAEDAPSYHPVSNTGDPATRGRGIQRAMTLLATSTPEHRNTVRVLFYGQSITEQDWWKIVADDLRRRFPDANLIIENRALGGFSSQRLVKTAETDLYSFYPDLMVFHVYGSHTEYENIIRRTRERTTAEVLIQTDHCNRDENLTEETAPAKLIPDGKIWGAFMNYKFLPETASKYGCALLDQRNLWKQYLTENKLAAKDLLRDGVHLNSHGCFVMAEIVKAYLIKRDDVTLDPMNCDTVKTFTIGKELQWSAGKLALAFEGNRVDVVVKEGPGAPAPFLIDGKKPSQFPELYQFTRALAKPGGKWPVVMDLSYEKPPILEEWTMQVRKDSAESNRYAFTLEGSRTGPDGEGSSDQRFVSKSGRIVIDPEDWDVDYALGLAKVKPVPDKFTVKWAVVPRFVDEFVSPGIKDSKSETVVTLAQGLSNSPHTLEIAGGPQTPIAALRIYRPPFRKNTP